MSRPIPRKFRGEPDYSDEKRPSGLRLFYGFRIPGYLLLAGVLTFLSFHFFSGSTQAKPVLPEVMEGCFSPKCRLCGEIKQNESLFITLTKAGMSPKTVHEINEGFKGVFDLKKILPGDRFTLDTDGSGNIVKFELERSPWEKYCISRQGECLLGVKDTVPLTYVIRAVKGEVKSTLWESMVNLGVPPEVILRFTDILSYNVDFLTETRDGHKFSLLYEEYVYRGQVINVGRVIAAEYKLSETSTHGGIYYTDPENTSGYYSLNGKNTRKTLLKTPLSFRRISSHFTKARYHPILKIYRPHLGVDYAAPSGTPVSASGSGVVTSAGWNGGFGNFIEIKHEGGIVTQYGHLKGYAKGIKRGASVKQGQLIGYVGSTGLSTGPHLDYRVKVNGKFVNPLRYAFPDGPPVKDKYIGDFKSKASDYLALLNTMTREEIVQLSQ